MIGFTKKSNENGVNLKMNKMKTTKQLISIISFSVIGVGLFFSYQWYHKFAKINSDSGVNHQPSLSKPPQKIRKTHLTPPKKSDKKNHSAQLKIIMNDPTMKKLKWGLDKTDVKNAWDITAGSKNVVVAIIDTGADIKHNDLKNNLWVNKGETGVDAKGRSKERNGIDDDQNGFIDDVHGWNFVDNNNNLDDHHGHGTHIAGIVGAHGLNSHSAIGVSPNVSLMILKYYDPTSAANNNLRNTVRAIEYATAMNVHIINYSGGGLEPSKEEHDAITAANKKGILFVAAAGNEKTNSDHSKYYPADYKISNIISVTAVDESTKILPTSNYGVHTVDIAAPGLNIFSTLPNNQHGIMTGTSQATAFVTGVAALVFANNNEFNASSVKKYILRTGDEIPSLLNKVGTSKQINSFKALSTLDQGVGLTGVVATNTVNMRNSQFSSVNQSNFRDPGLIDPTKGQAQQMLNWGNHMLRVLSQQN